MEFIITISSNKLRDLLPIFNKRFKNATYEIIESKEDITKINIKCNDENEDIIEFLLDDFSSILIEDVVKFEGHNKEIKSLKINADGYCYVFDSNSQIIHDLCGYWKDIYKVILNNINHETTIEDKRK